MALIMKTVCIVGAHPDTIGNAPYDDATKDIWGINEHAGMHIYKKNGELLQVGKYPRITALLQLHVPAVYRNPANMSHPANPKKKDVGHWGWLQQEHEYPIYMQDVDPGVPASVKYPLDEILDKYLSDIVFIQGKEETRLEYFTSTFPYAIALAIYQGYEKIEVYGVEMSNGTEWEYQRSCYAFWLGLARGAGIKIELHSGFSIFDRLLYGYDGDQVTLDADFFSENLDSLYGKFKHLNRQHKGLRKAIEIAAKDNRHDVFAELSNKRQELAIEEGRVAGTIGELERYLAKIKVTEDSTGDPHAIDRNEYELGGGQAMLRAEEYKNTMWMNAGMANYVWNTWLQTNSPEALKQLMNLHNNHIQAAYDTGAMLGIYETNIQLMDEMDNRIQAAGGQKSVAALTGGIGENTAAMVPA